MGRTKGAYKAEYSVGTMVKVADREVLERFQREWTLHHPLVSSQLDCSGVEARVSKVDFYHGGDEIYTLEGLPGLWHERLLCASSVTGAVRLQSASRARRFLAVALGLLAAIVSTYGLFLAFMLLGGVTGVVAMCPRGPEWWARTFFGLLIAVPLLSGTGLGIFVGRWCWRRAALRDA